MTSLTAISASTNTFPAASSAGFAVMHQAMAIQQGVAENRINTINATQCCWGGLL